ncbi:MAG: hypothetical protein HY691_13940 [Chloroflexi bacterium]|nr:hypothetical protein [Chloroflexota bacterium]
MKATLGRRGVRRAAEIRELLRDEQRTAVDTRDPLVIRKMTDRYRAIDEVLEGLADDAPVDLWAAMVGVSQTARALGFTAWQVRQMIREGKLQARKVGNEWRIPLSAVL